MLPNQRSRPAVHHSPTKAINISPPRMPAIEIVISFSWNGPLICLMESSVDGAPVFCPPGTSLGGPTATSPLRSPTTIVSPPPGSIGAVARNDGDVASSDDAQGVVESAGP